jgi:hypothetical protein
MVKTRQHVQFSRAMLVRARITLRLKWFAHFIVMPLHMQKTPSNHNVGACARENCEQTPAAERVVPTLFIKAANKDAACNQQSFDKGRA